MWSNVDSVKKIKGLEHGARRRAVVWIAKSRAGSDQTSSTGGVVTSSEIEYAMKREKPARARG
jgi:hypothetical protein